LSTRPNIIQYQKEKIEYREIIFTEQELNLKKLEEAIYNGENLMLSIKNYCARENHLFGGYFLKYSPLKAIPYLEIASRIGYDQASLLLGEIYRDGIEGVERDGVEGVKIDKRKAKDCFRKVIEAGNPWGWFYLWNLTKMDRRFTKQRFKEIQENIGGLEEKFEKWEDPEGRREAFTKLAGLYDEIGEWRGSVRCRRAAKAAEKEMEE
jgi:hypothetical protein